jgi:transposase
VLCVDEQTQVQALDRTAPILPLLPGTPQRASHDDTRHGTTNLDAALDVAGGKVSSQMTPRHRAIEFKRLLAHIDQQVPAGLDVQVICDNSSTHKTPAIGRWLVRHPRFHLHFTPTYSSWLNLVERWFAELTTKWLRRGTHRSVSQLKRSIQSWIDTWNQNPRPFVWTRPPTRSSTPSHPTANESTTRDTSCWKPATTIRQPRSWTPPWGSPSGCATSCTPGGHGRGRRSSARRHSRQHPSAPRMRHDSSAGSASSPSSGATTTRRWTGTADPSPLARSSATAPAWPAPTTTSASSPSSGATTTRPWTGTADPSPSTSSDALVDLCEQEQLVFLPWAPIEDLGRSRRQALQRIAERHHASPQQVALAWLLARSPAILPIPGTSSVAHLEDNVAAAGLRLDPAEVDALTGS